MTSETTKTERYTPSAIEPKWLEERAKDVLPVEYFHIVFTLPEPLAAQLTTQ